MELTIQQGDLAFAVGRALGSVQQKTANPLLSCVLLEADKNGLRVTGTDLDVTTSVLVPCSVSVPGRLAIGARRPDSAGGTGTAKPSSSQSPPAIQAHGHVIGS